MLTMKIALLAAFCLLNTEGRPENLVTKREEIPFIHFAHAGYEEPEYFQHYNGRINKLARCVKRETPPRTGESCTREDKTCLFGEQACLDGSSQPLTRCDCRGGEWLCHQFSCPDMDDFSCPVMPPKEGYVGRKDQWCDYGEAKCCGQTFPTTYCVGLAGTPFTCTDYNPCEDTTKTCTQKMENLRKHAKSPKPVKPTRSAVKIDDTKLKTTILAENPASCPTDQPDYAFEDECSADTDYSCHYGYSCCCPDRTQCSSDLKCECKDGKLKCEPKTCDMFLCDGRPKPPKSPFKEDLLDLSPNCPSYQYATALPEATKGECTVPEQGKAFFHCMYGFSCCCQDAISCSSELACTCQHGVFSCIPRDCPVCDAEEEAEPVICPRDLPETGMGCPTNEGETCGYGEYECCDGAKYKGQYCSCVGGEWECTDSSYLCGYTECSDK